MKVFSIFILCLLPLVAQANAGRILYVSGAVTVERGGKLYRAVPRAAVIEGDQLDTGQAGRVHIRMSDRSMLSLKPNTTFTIEEYRFEPEPPEAEEESTAARLARSEAGRSFFRLVRGGFRAVTGLIGQVNRDAFSVGTPVATIGIRGTSFVADLEDTRGTATTAAAEMQWMLASASLDALPLMPSSIRTDVAAPLQLAQAGDGGGGGLRLTVGVGDGAVILSGPDGSLLLENGEFGVVEPGSPPRLLLGQISDSEAPGDDADGEDEGGDGTGGGPGTQIQPVDGAPGDFNDPPDGNEGELVTRDTEPVDQRNLAFTTLTLSGPGFSAEGSPQALTLGSAAALTDSNGDIVAFVGGVDDNGTTVPAVFELGAGQVVNRGADPALGLRWGRWSGGDGHLRFADGGEQSFDLGAAQLHLVQSAVRNGAAALPVTGSRQFALIGNTNPTDQNGQVGFLGRASLSANFDAGTVASSLGLTLGDTVWSASGNGNLGPALGAGTPGNIFAGDYSVDVGGAAGTGRFSGFLTNQAAGAGLSYRLNGGGNTVNGVAAFAAQPASGAQ